MFAIYSHPACLAHDPGPGHPECPARLAAVIKALRAAFPDADWREAPRATRAQLAQAHTDALIRRVLDTPIAGRVPIDADTVMSEGSPEAALRAAGAAVAAVDAVLAGQLDRAFCAVRPPGHHATAGTAMGFCLFNAVAVAAMHALHAHGLARVAIVDFDVHHGNGTQDIFAAEPRVLYLSSHQAPLYPGTGSAADTGVGNLANVPLPPRTDGAAFRAAWRDRLLPVLEHFSPQLILVSAGFDAHRLDPLADLDIDAGDYAWLTGELVRIAGHHAHGRLVSLLEGGYSLTALRESSVAHVGELRRA